MAGAIDDTANGVKKDPFEGPALELAVMIVGGFSTAKESTPVQRKAFEIINLIMNSATDAATSSSSTKHADAATQAGKKQSTKSGAAHRDPGSSYEELPTVTSNDRAVTGLAEDLLNSYKERIKEQRDLINHLCQEQITRGQLKEQIDTLRQLLQADQVAIAKLKSDLVVCRAHAGFQLDKIIDLRKRVREEIASERNEMYLDQAAVLEKSAVARMAQNDAWEEDIQAKLDRGREASQKADTFLQRIEQLNDDIRTYEETMENGQGSDSNDESSETSESSFGQTSSEAANDRITNNEDHSTSQARSGYPYQAYVEDAMSTSDNSLGQHDNNEMRWGDNTMGFNWSQHNDCWDCGINEQCDWHKPAKGSNSERHWGNATDSSSEPVAYRTLHDNNELYKEHSDRDRRIESDPDEMPELTKHCQYCGMNVQACYQACCFGAPFGSRWGKTSVVSAANNTWGSLLGAGQTFAGRAPSFETKLWSTKPEYKPSDSINERKRAYDDFDGDAVTEWDYVAEDQQGDVTSDCSSHDDPEKEDCPENSNASEPEFFEGEEELDCCGLPKAFGEYERQYPIEYEVNDSIWGDEFGDDHFTYVSNGPWEGLIISGPHRGKYRAGFGPPTEEVMQVYKNCEGKPLASALAQKAWNDHYPGHRIDSQEAPEDDDRSDLCNPDGHFWGMTPSRPTALHLRNPSNKPVRFSGEEVDESGLPTKFKKFAGEYETEYRTSGDISGGVCTYVSNGPWLGLIVGGQHRGKYAFGHEPPTDEDIAACREWIHKRPRVQDRNIQDVWTTHLSSNSLYKQGNLGDKTNASDQASTTPHDNHSDDQYKRQIQEQEAEVDELKHRLQCEKVEAALQAKTLAVKEAEIQALTDELQQARAALITTTSNRKLSSQSSSFSTLTHTPTSSQQSDSSMPGWFIWNKNQREEAPVENKAAKQYVWRDSPSCLPNNMSASPPLDPQELNWWNC